MEIHKHCWLSITWILKKLNSIQTHRTFQIWKTTLTAPFSTKLTFDNLSSLVLNIFYLILIIGLPLISYRELYVVAPIFSLAMYKILFSFSWLVDYNFQIYSQSRLSTQNRKSVGFLYSSAKSHHVFAPLK